MNYPGSNLPSNDALPSDITYRDLNDDYGITHYEGCLEPKHDACRKTGASKLPHKENAQ